MLVELGIDLQLRNWKPCATNGEHRLCKVHQVSTSTHGWAHQAAIDALVVCQVINSVASIQVQLSVPTWLDRERERGGSVHQHVKKKNRGTLTSNFYGKWHVFNIKSAG